MVSRTRKLLVAGLVLAIGVGLAWPFRRDGSRSRPVATPTGRVQPAIQPERLTGPVILRPAPTAGAMASLIDPPRREVGRIESPQNDVVIHRPVRPPELPSMPTQFMAPADITIPPSEIDEDDPRPVYFTGHPAAAEPSAPERIRHVIHNGDTLQRLAQRYLGDETRALDIFDLNREVLDNPHLLPIGAEIEIPALPGTVGGE